ncbi:hypothetical protein Fmac_005327 [Flemingia macrophylla]|uniref:RING-type E3 ubiquitin transferase n=1 Tax=Flemingia macrophylla TaxID=520843 RepID=A0ABD1N8G3_9FABA
MEDTAERVSGSYFSLMIIMEEELKVRSKDILRFDVGVTHRHYEGYVAPRFMTRETVLQTSVPITCESFLENNHGFLRSVLWSSSQDIPESLKQLERRIVLRVQEDLEVQTNTCTDSDSKCQEYSLSLDILIETVQHAVNNDDEEEDAVIEESMQQGVPMIPASNEAIHSLKACTDSLFLKTETCNICMEKFEDDQDQLLSMPCTHVFHAHCIVKWLQISHTCPLCRYPMPTAEDY